MFSENLNNLKVYKILLYDVKQGENFQLKRFFGIISSVYYLWLIKKIIFTVEFIY